MDIGAGKGYPESALSNFAPHPFTFCGLPVASMEGLLQSLKFDKPHMQIHVMTLVGLKAKNKGRKRNKAWKSKQTLWWQGQPMDRHCAEYQAFLDRAFEALFTNESARRALLATGDAVLDHSIGKSDPRDTVLTRAEFVSRLTRIRARLKQEQRAQARAY